MQSFASVDEFDKALSNNSKVVIDFWAPWCGPCRILGPIFEKLAAADTSGVLYGKVDVDKVPDLASRYNILGIPTLLFFKDGKLVDKTSGLPSSDEVLAETIKNSLGA